jgi:hypothetical protein
MREQLELEETVELLDKRKGGIPAAGEVECRFVEENAFCVARKGEFVAVRETEEGRLDAPQRSATA